MRLALGLPPADLSVAMLALDWTVIIEASAIVVLGVLEVNVLVVVDEPMSDYRTLLN